MTDGRTTGGRTTDARRPATPPVLAGTAVWRAVLVACGLVGLIGTLAGRPLGTGLSELSQQASLATAAIYTGLLLYPLAVHGRFHEPRSPWWRGAIAVVLVDVLFVGRNLRNVSWWSVLGWLVLPLAYLAYYNLAELDAYDIPLRVDQSGFVGNFAQLLAGTVLVAVVLVAAGKLRARSGQQVAQHPAEQQPT